jgi:DNA-binding FrmR family transcriptional regulator
MTKKNPCHTSQLKRLNRIEGKVRGISKMIEDGRYCVDILTQLKAIKAAITKVESGVMHTHLTHCLQDAIKSGSQKQKSEKIEEIIKLLEKR